MCVSVQNNAEGWNLTLIFGNSQTTNNTSTLEYIPPSQEHDITMHDDFCTKVSIFFSLDVTFLKSLLRSLKGKVYNFTCRGSNFLTNRKHNSKVSSVLRSQKPTKFWYVFHSKLWISHGKVRPQWYSDSSQAELLFSCTVNSPMDCNYVMPKPQLFSGYDQR